jgi:hypothetical protein
MKRTVKQFLYGILFLAAITLVAFGAYRIWFYKTPTCFDNIQNGSETGIDCGGSCMPCEIKNLKLDVSEAPRVFPAIGDQSILFAKVVNPSSTYAVKSFSYRLQVWSVLGVPIKTFTGSSYIAPGGTRYLVFPNLASAAANVEQPIAPLEISDVVWAQADSFSDYNLQISDVTTVVTASGGEVDCIVANKSQSNVPLRITALLFDVNGSIVSASTGPVQNLAPFSTQQFQIYFPPLGRTAGLVNRTKTLVSYEVVKN